MNRPFFIAFEGIDGSGKSTQAALLADKLQQEGMRVHFTAEPTKTRIGALLRDIFNHKMEADHRTIAALFVADRLDHLLDKTNGVLRKMQDGYTVIMDRYYFSSYAYHGTHMDIDWVIQANSLSAGLLRPDLTIFIDTAVEESTRRLQRGRNAIELYETAENLRNVRTKYFEAFEKLGNVEKIYITDGNRPEQEIATDVWTRINELRKRLETNHAKEASSSPQG
jgi:dTMP kinase